MDSLSEISLKLGFNVSVLTTKPEDGYIGIIRGREIKQKHTIYHISINRININPRVNFGKQQDEWINYKGLVHCIHVKHNTLFIRRNGKSLWCGNSPPYFSAKDYGNKSSGNIGNAQGDDDMTPYQVYMEMMLQVFKEVYRVLKPGRYFMMNAAPIVYEEQRYPVPYHLLNLMEEVGFNYQDMIVWKKPDGITSSKRFGVCMQNPYPLYYKPNNVYEPCFLMRKGDSEYPKEQHQLSIDKLKLYQNDVWNIQPDTHNEHPAPFPYKLAWNFVYALCPRNETVLDMFGGSGTTSLVARDLGIDCVLYELEQEYVDMIKERVASSQGLGKFVKGAKDFKLELVEQENVVFTPVKKISPTNSMKKQVHIYPIHIYACTKCSVEMEINNNQYFNYDLSKWRPFENKCLVCGSDVKEVI